MIMSSDLLFPQSISSLAAEFVAILAKRGWQVTTAESCTGGLIAAAITDIPGASAVFRRGIVAYANQEKTALLDVSEDILNQYGAVSTQVAQAMAAGALFHAKADIALAVTGVAGPGGGSPDKPVGLVHLVALGKEAEEDLCLHHREIFTGHRSDIRQATVRHALQMGISLAGHSI